MKHYLHQGWRVTLASAGINFLVGINYTWSIYATGLVEQVGWDYSQASLPYALFLFCYAMFMVPAGRAQDFFGPRPVIRLGSFFAGFAFLSCVLFFHQPIMAAVLWGLPLGIGLACCFASTTPASIKWFPPEKKGMITGFVVTSTGLAALVMSPIIYRLIQLGITEAFIASGLILIAGILILAHFVINPPVKLKDIRKIWNKRPATGTLNHLLLKFWVMFFLTTGTGVTMAAHLDNIMRIQTNYERGYIAVSLYALCNASGRMLGGILSDKLGRTKALRLIFSTMAIMIVSGALATNPIHLMLSVSVMTLAFGSLFSIFPSAAVQFFGESHFGFYYGIIFTGLGAAGIFPYLAGWFFELQGHYLSTYLMLLVTTCIALLLSLKLRDSN